MSIKKSTYNRVRERNACAEIDCLPTEVEHIPIPRKAFFYEQRRWNQSEEKQEKIKHPDQLIRNDDPWRPFDYISAGQNNNEVDKKKRNDGKQKESHGLEDVRK